MAIKKRLAKYPVPDFLWDEYHLDQEINDRGSMLDMQVVENAITFDEKSKSELMLSMQNITNLDNPNSVIQMKQWLSDQGVEMESLGKKEVAQFVKNSDDNANGNITEALKLRLQLAKSSVKKYLAMQNAVCKDGRAHGMFQFYGANHSGRWAGRLIQLQNLPQNHMNDLAEARAIVKASDYDILQLLYDDIPDTLSQLIRTAFVPRPGDTSSLSATSPPLRPESLLILQVRNGGLRYLQKGKIYTVPLLLRCSAYLWKSTASTAISVKRGKLQNWLSDTADPSVL